MKTLLSNLVLLDNNNLLPTAVGNGLTSVEEIQDTKNNFEYFLCELEKEWTPERIREVVIQKRRNDYQSTARLIQKIELDNRDARVRGMSYKDRESTFTVKLTIGKQLLQNIKQKAYEDKKRTYILRELISPVDMPFIRQEGFEKFLNSSYPL